MKQIFIPQKYQQDRSFIENCLNVTEQQKKYDDQEPYIYQHHEVLNNSQASIEQDKGLNNCFTINQAEEDMFYHLQQLISEKQKAKVQNNINVIIEESNQEDNHQLIQKFQQILNRTRQQSEKNKTQKYIKAQLQKQGQNQYIFKDTSLIDFQLQLQNLQSLMKDYRSELIKYQMIFHKKEQDFNDEKQILKKNVDDLIVKLDISKSYEVEQEKQIILLARQNQQLKTQLINYTSRMSKDTKASRSKSKSHSNNTSMKVKMQIKALSKHISQEQSENFSQAVREQLQDMIESLVMEVEHLRNINQKLKDEIKNLNKVIVQSERTIMKKNEKIYQLEKDIITTKRENLVSPKNMRFSGIIGNQPLVRSHITSSQQVESRHVQIKFSLADVINKKRLITNIEKLVIARKMIEFYEQKIKQKNYEMLMAQDIIIFSKGELQTVQIRPYNNNLEYKDKPLKISQQKKQNLTDNVLWNLNFMLEELFKKSNDKNFNSLTDIIQNKIKNIINQIFDDREGKKLIYISELKQILQNSIFNKDK